MKKQDMTRDWKATAETLSRAVPYLQRFDDAIVVIKLGGHAMSSNEALLEFARDVVLIEFAMRTSWVVLLISSLSFLGFGASPPTPDWGLMVNENREILKAINYMKKLTIMNKNYIIKLKRLDKLNNLLIILIWIFPILLFMKTN